jgi:hypothetical protein
MRIVSGDAQRSKFTAARRRSLMAPGPLAANIFNFPPRHPETDR